MKKAYTELDFHLGFLSAYDLAGSLMVRDLSESPKGLEQDIEKLMQDQQLLEKDYRISCEKTLKFKAKQ